MLWKRLWKDMEFEGLKRVWTLCNLRVNDKDACASEYVKHRIFERQDRE